VITATVAIYPLQQDGWEAVDRAIAALRAAGLDLEIRTMQTEVTGETAAVFAALQSAFEAAAALGGVVLTVTVSNTCPV
jgi:uncharacterized protein YqgV (UPF0045/DUF77 family)